MEQPKPSKDGKQSKDALDSAKKTAENKGKGAADLDMGQKK